MFEKMKQKSPVGGLIVENLLRFLENLILIMIFQSLFGAENILAGVAICVGFTMFREVDLGIEPLTMGGIIVGLYTFCGLLGQTALLPAWIALPLNLAFVLVMMALTCEPMLYKPSVTFLLCFVFCQATPVPWPELGTRLLGNFLGGLFVAVVTVLIWRKKGWSTGRTLREQIALCVKSRSYLLRMALGIAIAMFAGMVLGLKKPLWISIVAMSLTQLDFLQTVERIKHRTIGTLVGVAVFVVLFRILIPERYSMLLVLLLGYLSFFTPEYKHKQIVNAISAINASLVLLDTSTAIANRLLCLLGGALIVLALHLAELLAKKAAARRPVHFGPHKHAGGGV